MSSQRKKKNSSGIDGVYEFLSLDVPSAERIDMCQVGSHQHVLGLGSMCYINFPVH